MSQLLDSLKIGIIEGLTPKFIKAMENATGNRYPTKEECENNNPFYFFDTYKDEVVEAKETHPVTVTLTLKKGINY